MYDTSASESTPVCEVELLCKTRPGTHVDEPLIYISGFGIFF